MDQLKDIGEDSLITRLVNGLSKGQDVVVGPGDDCAVIDVGDAQRYQLLKTDCIVEDVHFLAGAPAEQVGWKAIARVVSDFAAMGGRPAQLLVTIVMPGTQKLKYVEALYQGMEECAKLFGAVISGGETSSVPEGSASVISISGTGWVEKSMLVRRSNGHAGDVVLVTGLLGGSIKGKHLCFTPRVEEANWLAENFDITAMMDISDGLAKDLPRLAKASHCGYVINESDVPCSDGSDIAGALSDGEDYELLLAVAPDKLDTLLAKWTGRFPHLALTKIGTLTGDTKEEPFDGGGWEHFTS